MIDGEHEFLDVNNFVPATNNTNPSLVRCKHCGLTKEMILQSDITGCKGKHNNYFDDDAKTFVARVDLLERIKNDHTHHQPKQDQLYRYEKNRNLAKELATKLIINCPPSRELSMALTHLDEVVFWANAAIARGK